MIKLIIDEDSIAAGKNGQVTGGICFETSHGYFPSEKWNDFVVTTLSWWANNFINYMQTKAKKTDFTFMDGPYCIRIQSSGKAESTFHFYYNDEEMVPLSESICFDELYEILLRGCLKVLNALEKLDIEFSKVQALKRTTERLKELTI